MYKLTSLENTILEDLFDKKGIKTIDNLHKTCKQEYTSLRISKTKIRDFLNEKRIYKSKPKKNRSKIVPKNTDTVENSTIKEVDDKSTLDEQKIPI